MYPNQIITNQFGETQNQFIRGGSNAINLSFKVASSDAAGFGLTGLTGAGIAAAYMHTSVTPGAGSPNPLAGYLAVKLSNGYKGFLGYTSSVQSPISGTPISISSGVTAGQIYTIQSLGSTSTVNWNSLGLPAGIVPAIGVAFIASASISGVGTGTVEVPLATGSGTVALELVGSSTLDVGGSAGGWIYFQFLIPTNSTTTTLKAGVPADGSIVNMSLSLLPQIGAPLN